MRLTHQQFNVIKRFDQRGSSLIEVLVSIVVVSIGLLGLAGMYNYTMANSKGASSRLAATLLTQDYAEMARANPEGFRAGLYNNDIGTYDPNAVAVGAQPTPACTFPNCTSILLAQLNVNEFRWRLRSHLPAGNYHASRVGNTNNLDIWIVWVEGKSSEGADMRDTCPQAVIDIKPDLTPYPRCLYTRVAL